MVPGDLSPIQNSRSGDGERLRLSDYRMRPAFRRAQTQTTNSSTLATARLGPERSVMRATVTALVIIPLVLGLATHSASASWPTDPTVNLPISSATADQTLSGFGHSIHSVCPDGSGGLIIAWQDARNSTSDIYVQRVDGQGNPRWTVDGRAVCTATGDQASPAVVSDGQFGAIIAWHDKRSGTRWDIYAQRIDADGNALWAGNGVFISTVSWDERWPAMIERAGGGAIVAYAAEGGAGLEAIGLRSLNADGTIAWASGFNNQSPANSTAPFEIDVISDGAGGVIVAWAEEVSGQDWDVYTQRASASGSILWGASPVSVCTATDIQLTPRLAYDGFNGAILVWRDFRAGNTNADIYAHRVSSAGAPLWSSDGNALLAGSTGELASIVTDDAGGAIVMWKDTRGGLAGSIHGQRVDGNGIVQWAANGLEISDFLTIDPGRPQLVRDGSGGAIVTYSRVGVGGYDIYAQRVNAAGAAQWASDAAVSTVSSNQVEPHPVPNGQGGVVVAWQDTRNGDDDIYGQQVDANGSIGLPTGVDDDLPLRSGRLSLANTPNPFSVRTEITYTLREAALVTLDVFDVRGRRVAHRFHHGTVGQNRLTFDGRSEGGKPLSAGVYFYRLSLEDGLVETKRMVIVR